MQKETMTSTATVVAPSDSPAGAAVSPLPATKVIVPPRPGRLTRKSTTSRRIKRAIWALLGAGIATALGLGLRPHPVPVETAIASRGTLIVTVDEDGRTRVKDRYLVSAPLGGSVVRIALKPGDSVARGAIVARVVPTAAPLLDPRSRAESQARVAAARAAMSQAGTAVERARAAYELAGRDADRQRMLARNGATSTQLLEQAETAERIRREELASSEFGLRVADSEVRLAQAALARIAAPGREEFSVRAPVGGQVLRVFQESEAVVQAGTPLLEIGNPLVLEIVVDVLTTDAIEIRPGDPVRIERWGGTAALAGQVHRIEPSAFTRLSALGVEEQRVNVLIDPIGPIDQWKSLGDGYRVETSIQVWEGRDRLLIPGGAVFRLDAGWATYAVNGGRARLRPIELGRRSTEAVEVVGGLRGGERVVLYPTDNVVDGVRTVIQK